MTISKRQPLFAGAMVRENVGRQPSRIMFVAVSVGTARDQTVHVSTDTTVSPMTLQFFGLPKDPRNTVVAVLWIFIA